MKQVGYEIVNKLVETNSFFFVAVLKLLHCVDDTKLLTKLVLRPLCEDILSLLSTKVGYTVISSLYLPKHNELSQFDSKASLPNTHSKKDQEVRLLELTQAISSTVLYAFDQVEDDRLLKEVSFSRFTAGVLRAVVKGIILSYYMIR